MSSKWVSIALVGFLTSIASVDTVLAQRGGGGMRGRGGIVGIATSEAVQKEIGIGETEKQKIADIAQAFGEEVRSQFQGFQNATAEERQKIGAKIQELNQKHAASIKEIVKPEQYKRLQQISWQAAGSVAFNDPELIAALELSKEQQDKIREVNQEYQQKQFALFSGGGGGDDVRTKARELGQERDKKVLEILSKEQQEKFTQLKGKEFDLSQLQQGGPGGRGEKKE